MNKNTKIIKPVSALIILFLIASAIYFFVFKKPVSNTIKPVSTSTPVAVEKNIQYKNTKYGFTFTLPDSWKGYMIVDDEWDGYAISDIGQQNITETGPLLFIRHPKWTEDVQRQDIPIMIFTLEEWSKLQNDDFHIGAAPVGPNEIGRNSKYVFAIPARYNFSYLVGYEEVERIIQSKKFTTF